MLIYFTFRNTTVTFFAPQRKADVAQSKAVSPAPKTNTRPFNLGNLSAVLEQEQLLHELLTIPKS